MIQSVVHIALLARDYDEAIDFYTNKLHFELDIKAIDKSACINRLYAIEGAIQGVRWHAMSDQVKSGLKEFYNTAK